MPFASIRKIYAPQKGDQALDIELSDNEFETIAVLGETGDIPDIYAFESFLQYLIKYPSPDIFDELKSVETKEDLVTLMEKHFGKNCGSETQSRIESFEDEFVQNNIDPAIKQAKGFWRLIGLWRIDDALLSDSDDDY